MCDEGETADRADAVRTESQKMESRAGETALDGSARSIIVLIVVGMLVGVLSGMFGIGGGTVIVPALVWLGLSQRNAAATSTLAIVPTSISGVVSYATGGHVDWLAAVLLFCGMFVGGQIGSWLLSRLPELVLRWIFVAFLVFVVINQVSFVPSRDHQIVMTVATGVCLALLGVVIGMLAGLLGIGGGALAVPALSILFGASDLIARGTSLLAMFPNSITTSVANMKRNLVHVKAALIIGLVAAVTAPLGTWIAGEVSPRVGAIMFACYLCVLLVRSVFVAVKATRAARVARG
ncbi:sulfite exporter TauE/SafE family protein [Bifidobacterium adolescentis]|nr:sulfite exporter TauE/SafE family protein [Bifidobacterium adolescentis]RGX57312.1 sulfite exporter TauE/SafE family protein [Bifidobacterium adolescentis]RGX57512.1 sulfite exporter TauE/SafE family protein [Bifidobacterium adolescentis]